MAALLHKADTFIQSSDWKFAGLLGLFVATLAGIFVFTFAMFASQQTDALVIDLAGRQRMLHQRHMKEVLLADDRRAVDPRPTRELLAVTLAALIDGGPAPLSLDGKQVVTLPAAPTQTIRATLLEQRRLTEVFTAKADQFLRLSPGEPGYEARLEELLTLSESLQEISNETVRLFDAHSEAKLSGLISLEIVVALIVGLVGVLLMRRLRDANQGLRVEVAERRHAEQVLKEAETALRESEGKLRSIIENTTDAIMLKDLEGRYLVINAAGASVLGRTVTEVIGRRDDELFDHESAQGIMAFDRRVMTLGTPLTTEELLTVGGVPRWFSTSKAPYVTPDGHVLGLIGLAHDITERKRTEEKLRESQAKLHRITDAIPGAVYQYALTPSGEQRLLYVSRGVQELMGLTAEQAQAAFDRVWALTHPEDAAGLWASVERSAQSLAPWAHEFRIVVDGTVKWLRGSSIPEQPKADGTIVWNGILVDVTERKRAEEELRKSKEKTIAALRESDALKSALLSSVSHELRTPLAAIKAMVSTAFAGHARASLEVQQEFLEAMHREVDYLNRLVDNLLDMSRIEAGALVPRREWQLLDEIIEGAIRRLGTDRRGCALELEIEEDLPPVYLDAVEIQQVLVNLLDNAVKYSSGDVPIRIEALRAGEHVEVRVRNHGDTVPPEDRDRIFDRFYRVRSAATQRIRGTGLGLAICKAFVEAHGGAIWCECGPNTTVLAFTIPHAGRPAPAPLENQVCPAGSEP